MELREEDGVALLVPGSFRYLDELPRTLTGKVLRGELSAH